MPVYAELQEKYEVEYIAGGATQNTIRVAAWMLSGRKKRPECAYVGCVGNDEYGRKLAATCAAGGVHTNYQIDEETPTGTCAVLISRADGERRRGTSARRARRQGLRSRPFSARFG
jgi:adenosine kinase